jgi:hypothetical protein
MCASVWQLSARRIAKLKEYELAKNVARAGASRVEGGEQMEVEGGAACSARGDRRMDGDDDDDDDDDDDAAYGEDQGGSQWPCTLPPSPGCTSARARILRRLDKLRYACAEGALDELAACSTTLAPVIASWPEGEGKYKAIMALASFLCTSDEAWTVRTAMDDDGTNNTVGWRNLLMEPLRRTAATSLAHAAAGSTVHMLMQLPAQPELWCAWRDAAIQSEVIKQRNGRIDTHDNQSEALNGYPNSKWIRNMNHVQYRGAMLQAARSYQDVRDAVESLTNAPRKSDRKPQGFTLLRLAWIVGTLVRYLPHVRDETLSRHLETPATVGVVQLLGAERAAAFHDTLHVNVGVILLTTLHHVLTKRMKNNLTVCSDPLRDAFAKEACICEDDRELKDMARCYFELAQRQEKGSTQALTPSPSGAPAQICLHLSHAHPSVSPLVCLMVYRPRTHLR